MSGGESQPHPEGGGDAGEAREVSVANAAADAVGEARAQPVSVPGPREIEEGREDFPAGIEVPEVPFRLTDGTAPRSAAGTRAGRSTGGADGTGVAASPDPIPGSISGSAADSASGSPSPGASGSTLVTSAAPGASGDTGVEAPAPTPSLPTLRGASGASAP